MDQETAIMYLQRAVDEIKQLKKSYRFSEIHTKWVAVTLDLLEEIFGQSSSIYGNFLSLPWEYQGTYVTRGFGDVQAEIERVKHFGYLRNLESANGLLNAGIELIQRKGLEGVYEGKDTPRESSQILKIITLLQNKLRKVIRKIPEKEDDVNDAIENLFIASDLDGQFTREKETIPYSSKTYTPDFVFNKINTIVEGKYSKHKDRLRQIIGEINDYTLAFKTKYENVIFVVYDNGVIRDEEEFKKDIEDKEVVVLVIKH